MKKAQGLPITTVIIAALALLVLVIIVLVFTGRITMFGRGVSECPGRCPGQYSENADMGLPTQIDRDVKCASHEKALPGRYILKDQPSDRESKDLIYCSVCCVSAV